MANIDAIEFPVGYLLDVIAEQVGPSLSVRREATRARGDFAPSDDYPMTGPEMRAFIEEFLASDPYMGDALLKRRENFVIAVPVGHFDAFVRRLSDLALDSNWLGADGPYYVAVRKHLPDVKLRKSTKISIGNDKRPKIAESVQIHAPSLSILLGLFRQKIDLDRLEWRQLECLLAELLKAEGYDVQLGKGSKDGGADIVTERHFPTIGFVRTVWQAKHLRGGGKVGLAFVRELADVRNEFQATKGIIVTSSYLTRGALERVRRDEYQLGKCERPELEQWIQRTMGA